MASATTGPAIGWEEHGRRSSLPADLASRRLCERHSGPYRAAVLPPIATADVSLPSAVLALADEASVEITEFSGKRRGRYWQAPEILTALDDFAASAR